MKNKTLLKNPIFLFNYLSEKFYSKHEILDLFQIKESSFDKYIGIIRRAGFKIIRKKDNYKIFYSRNIFKLSPCETSLIAYLLYLSDFMLSIKNSAIFSDIIFTLIAFNANDDLLQIFNKYNFYKKITLKSNSNKKISLCEKYIQQKINIKIMTAKDEKYIYALPIDFTYEKKKVFLNYMDNQANVKKKILIDDCIKIVPINDIENYNEKETIFELYGKLAKIYLLKDNERIIDGSENKLVVANISSDKKSLFKRLMRYDTLCKIIYPESDILKFKKIIEKTIFNLGFSKESIVK